MGAFGAHAGTIGTTPLIIDYNAFSTIQNGVSAVVAGGNVIVAPGTYTENVTVNQPETIQGANAGINPNTGTRGTESIVTPGSNNPGSGVIFTVTAANVTIDGFTIDGDNSTLTGGTLLNGVPSNAADGIYALNATNLTVQNNIVKDHTAEGIQGTTNNGVAATGNVINNNKVDNLPSTGAQGIDLANNFYANVTNNVLTRVNVGIEAQNFTQQAIASSISNNQITYLNDGLVLSGISQNASTFSVTGNTISAGTGASSTNTGLLIGSIQGNVAVTLTNNNVTGAASGVELWNDSTSNTVTLTGGTLTGNVDGILATNNDANFGVGATTTVAVSGVTITNSSTAGVLVLGQAASSNPTITVNLIGSTLQTNPVGLEVVGSLATATVYRNTITASTTAGILATAGGNLGTAAQPTAQNFINNNKDAISVTASAGTIQPVFDNDLSGNTQAAILNTSTTTVNAGGNWWGINTELGVAPLVGSNVDYTPWLDVGTDTSPTTVGFQGSFNVLHVGAASPQAGAIGKLDEAIGEVTGTAPEIIVEAGTYTETAHVTVANLTITGASTTATNAVIQPGASNNGVVVTANNLTLENLSITGANNALVASNVATLNLINLAISNSTSGGALANVTTVNFTTTTPADTVSAYGNAQTIGTSNVEAISYANVTNLNVYALGGNDTTTVTPSPVNGTTILVSGGTSAGNTLIFNALGLGATQTGSTITATGRPAMSYIDMATVKFINSGAFTLGTTTANNVLTLTHTVGGNLGDLTYVLNGAPAIQVASAISFAFTGGSGTNSMTLNYVNGIPIPTSGVTFNGLAGSTSNILDVIGTGTQVDNYTPSSSTAGSGVETIDGYTLNFTGTQSLDVTGVKSVTLTTPNSSNNIVTVANGTTFLSAVPGLEFSGSSGGVNFSPVVFTSTTSGVVNTAANDVAGTGNDTLTVTGAAQGVQNLSLTTGTGTDKVIVSGAIDLPGTLAINTDTITLNGAVTTGGSINLNGQAGVNVNAAVTGSSTITIAANQAGAGAVGFTQTAPGSITTTSNTAGAVSITVNTAIGGTGNAALEAITSGIAGTITVAANNGAITDANGAGTLNLSSGTATLSGAGGINTDVNATTAVNANTSAANGAIILRSDSGNLPLGVINAGTGTVTLTGATGITDSTGPGILNITGSTVTLVASNGGIAADVKASTVVKADSSAGNGTISLQSVTGNLPLGAIKAGTGTVSLTGATGITDTLAAGTVNITGGIVTLVASNGGIATDVNASTAVNADSSAANGALSLTSVTGNLPLGVVTAGPGTVTLLAATGITDTLATGTLNITGGLVNLTASSGGIAADVNASTAVNANSSAANGAINLQSVTGNLPLAVMNAGTGTVTLTGATGITDTTAAGTLNITGSTVTLTAKGGGISADVNASTAVNANSSTANGTIRLQSDSGGSAARRH